MVSERFKASQNLFPQQRYQMLIQAAFFFFFLLVKTNKQPKSCASLFLFLHILDHFGWNLQEKKQTKTQNHCKYFNPLEGK